MRINIFVKVPAIFISIRPWLFKYIIVCDQSPSTHLLKLIKPKNYDGENEFQTKYTHF